MIAVQVADQNEADGVAIDPALFQGNSEDASQSIRKFSALAAT